LHSGSPDAGFLRIGPRKVGAYQGRLHPRRRLLNLTLWQRLIWGAVTRGSPSFFVLGKDKAPPGNRRHHFGLAGGARGPCPV